MQININNLGDAGFNVQRQFLPFLNYRKHAFNFNEDRIVYKSRKLKFFIVPGPYSVSKSKLQPTTFFGKFNTCFIWQELMLNM